MMPYRRDKASNHKSTALEFSHSRDSPFQQWSENSLTSSSSSSSSSDSESDDQEKQPGDDIIMKESSGHPSNNINNNINPNNNNYAARSNSTSSNILMTHPKSNNVCTDPSLSFVTSMADPKSEPGYIGDSTAKDAMQVQSYIKRNTSNTTSPTHTHEPLNNNNNVKLSPNSLVVVSTANSTAIAIATTNNTNVSNINTNANMINSAIGAASPAFCRRPPIKWTIESPSTEIAIGGKRRKGDGNQFICSQCSVTVSLKWRKGPCGINTLCNACGLQYAKWQKQAKGRKPGKVEIDFLLNPPRKRRKTESVTNK